jgi:hypothetical protein
MLKLLRRLVYCSRDIHCKPVYGDKSALGIGCAGYCSDCGAKWGSIRWPTTPMPSVKSPNDPDFDAADAWHRKHGVRK